MKVLDTEQWSWFLFVHESNYYLDVNCNISAFGYTYMIKLNECERKMYEVDGREYLNKLAHEIHYSVPIGKDSKSIYKGRDVGSEFRVLTSEAIEKWRECKV